MEIRIYPEYIGSHYEFQEFLLKHFRLIEYVIERHSVNAPVHVHALLKEPVKPIAPVTFKRMVQQYKKTKTNVKFRNNSFHINNCSNEPLFSDYLRRCKPDGLKEYYKLRHAYPFEMWVGK